MAVRDAAKWNVYFPQVLYPSLVTNFQKLCRKVVPFILWRPNVLSKEYLSTQEFEIYLTRVRTIVLQSAARGVSDLSCVILLIATSSGTVILKSLSYVLFSKFLMYLIIKFLFYLNHSSFYEKSEFSSIDWRV